MYIRQRMILLYQKLLKLLKILLIQVIKTGPLPKHVAMIMDGNRRWSKKNGFKPIEGHRKGYSTVTDTLEWCIRLGIKEITYYAFSIENFKRTENEVKNILDLAREKFHSILNNETDLMDRRVRIKVVGNISLLPKDLQWLCAETMRKTKDNDAIVFNLAFPYTSRDEISNAMKDVMKGVKRGEIKVDDIDENLISKCLYTHQSHDVDLLIRTSGEVRFSDFLMWQTSHACLYFTEVLWPDFDGWEFAKGILYYQRCYKHMKKLEYDLKQPDISNTTSSRPINFINRLHSKREMEFQQIAVNSKINGKTNFSSIPAGPK